METTTTSYAFTDKSIYDTQFAESSTSYFRKVVIVPGIEQQQAIIGSCGGYVFLVNRTMGEVVITLVHNKDQARLLVKMLNLVQNCVA